MRKLIDWQRAGASKKGNAEAAAAQGFAYIKQRVLDKSVNPLAQSAKGQCDAVAKRAKALAEASGANNEAAETLLGFAVML